MNSPLQNPNKEKNANLKHLKLEQKKKTKQNKLTEQWYKFWISVSTISHIFEIILYETNLTKVSSFVIEVLNWLTHFMPL